MEIRLFDSDCFVCPQSEQLLMIFKSNSKDYSDLIEFGYQCAFEEYQRDLQYQSDSWAQEYTWDKRKSIYNPIRLDR